MNEAGAPAPQRDARPAGRESVTGWHRAVDRLNVESSDGAQAAFASGGSAGAWEFLWEPVREFGRALRVRSACPRLQAAVLAAYARLVRAAKLWETEMRWRKQHLESFERGHVCGVARRGWRDRLEQVLASGEGGGPMAGGRGSTRRIVTERGNVIVRRFRRGGWMCWLGETYFGARPRPLREFEVLLRARRRGLPVPEPIAAMVERRFGIAYRGRLFMAEVVGGRPLLEFLEAEPGAEAAPLLARGLRAIHDQGLRHPDLSLGNILVVSGPDGPSAVFIDLDRARLFGSSLGEAERRRALARLRRSVAKLDPQGRRLPAGELDRMEALYWSAPAGAAHGVENPVGGC